MSFLWLILCWDHNSDTVMLCKTFQKLCLSFQKLTEATNLPLNLSREQKFRIGCSTRTIIRHIQEESKYAIYSEMNGEAINFRNF